MREEEDGARASAAKVRSVSNDVMWSNARSHRIAYGVKRVGCVNIQAGATSQVIASECEWERQHWSGAG
eukprot:6184993-Pleurochrysis_carterae.AAC.2